jgi:MFS family permease
MFVFPLIPFIPQANAQIIGRKPVYLTSFGVRTRVCRRWRDKTDNQFYTVGSIVASRAPTMPVLIGMRCLQAIGSSAVISVGAGSLADMYEVHERGQKV